MSTFSKGLTPRHDPAGRDFGRSFARAAVVSGTALLALSLFAASSAYAEGIAIKSTTEVPADAFAISAGSYLTMDAASMVTGNVAAGAAITGASASNVSGSRDDASSQATQIAVAANTALSSIAARPQAIGGELGGIPLGPGTYYSEAALGLTGTLTLQGGVNDIFIFQTPAALVTAAAAKVVLTGGAQAKNVYWQVGSYASLGATTTFEGTILADSYISFGASSHLDGRALSTTSYVVLDSTTIANPNVAAAASTQETGCNVGGSLYPLSQDFSVLAGSYVTTDDTTRVAGRVGAVGAVTNGAFTPPGTDAATTQQARGVASTAYQCAASLAASTEIPSDLSGSTMFPGVYHSTAPFVATAGDTLTLDGLGDNGSVFIFQTPAALVTGAGFTVNLVNNMRADHVFWQVGSYASLGASTEFKGALLADSYISLGAGTNLEGYAFSNNGYIVTDSSIIEFPKP